MKDFETLQRRDLNVVRRLRNEVSSDRYSRVAISPTVFFPVDFDHEEELQDTEQIAKSSRMIQEQNQIYKEFEIEAMKKKLRQEEEAKKAKEERQMQIELEQERSVRKMSIPDEPTDGDIVKLSFRCPNGKVIPRAFLAEEKLELVYNWIQTNDEIEFQNEKKRAFDLLMSYPPTSLQNRKEELLSEIFECRQQKIMIREL